MDNTAILKERIYGAVSIMNKEEVSYLWDIITSGFMHRSWEDIPETVPDEIDLQMIKEMEEDPDCHEFVSEEEALKALGIKI